MRSGRTLFVGESLRTNAAGIDTLREIVRKYDYTVVGVPIRECLHLKTACSALPDGRFLVNRDWIDVSSLPPRALIDVAKSEPMAGDVLVIDNRVIVSDAFPETTALLEQSGFDITPVAVSEFAKVEGGVTCLSLVFRALPG